MRNNLPAAVAASVRRALATIADADARWQVVVALDATLASGTRYQDESREKFAAETAGARSTLTTFRSICSTKGLDAEALLSELSKEA